MSVCSINDYQIFKSQLEKYIFEAFYFNDYIILFFLKNVFLVIFS